MTTLPPITLNPNTYTGFYYAFDTSGGFSVDQSFNPILLAGTRPKYDVTDSVQLFFDVRTLNTKLGILKDTSNVNVVQYSHNPDGTLTHDTIQLSTADLIGGVNTNNVVSVGRLQYLYSDFIHTVSTYFGAPSGQFSSLFSNASTFSINNGVFDASALIQTINSATFNIEGSYISDLSGNATIMDINNTLNSLLEFNTFNNRRPTIDQNNMNNNINLVPTVRKGSYGLADGFMAGDNIFIPDGLTITMYLDIQSITGSYPGYANTGATNLAAIDSQINYTSGYISKRTTYSTTQIKQVTKLPILLLLVDTELQHNNTYGSTWSIATHVSANGSITDPSLNWMAISISTDGQYQCAITDQGHIYISQDYGVTRVNHYSIGPSPSNSISMSYTGQYQTASNGHSIYVSSDYGDTWMQTFSGGTSNIFVSISLNGMYQTVLSTGDNVYVSSDYGQTWTQFVMTSDSTNQGSVYQSVEGFPTAGVCLSYDGRYQTIVSENIYISSDYGVTWTNVSDPTNGFIDGNWQGVALSSDGMYQTAIDNGGKVYISNDYGAIWTIVSQDIMQNKTWVSVAMSATGQYQTILEQNGHIYVSYNYGAQWTRVTDPLVTGKDLRSVSISSNALYQCVVEYGGQIYMSTTM
jgi:photosystem II stability/assembly factor-like uncharacterized protein